MSPNTVTSCLKHLEKIAIVREITRRRRDRVFVYFPYMEVLGAGL
ncbi:MAG: hypothetical protein WCH07_03295 [Deltaproteobacteria bacterium]